MPAPFYPNSRWRGDFTVPRFRAKLARKYLIHPGVEPEYAEFYQPEFNRIVIRRTPEPHQELVRSHSASFSFGGRSKSSKPGSDSGFDNVGARPPAKKQSAIVRERPRSEQMLFRSNSVPCLGTRRALLAPANRQPVPPTMDAPDPRSYRRSPSEASLANQPSPPPADDPKAIEKELQIERASRRLWVAANGNQHFLAEEVCQLRLEDPLMSNQTLMNRLKSTQVCQQMNKARREGARVDWRSTEWDGATLLLKAVRTGSQALAMHLIAIGADPQAVDHTGRGLLHWLAIEGNASLAAYVFDTVSDLQPDLVDEGGDAPLHLAAYHGHLAVVRLLLRSGADVTLRSASGFSAMDLATVQRMWHVANFLQEFCLLEEEARYDDGEPLKLRNLVRPCNALRAAEVRRVWADRPKPKK